MDFLHAWIVPSNATAGPLAYCVTAVIALLVTAVSKGGFGGGVGIMSVPLMLQVAPAEFVVGMWLPVLIACDSATIHQYPKEWSRETFKQLLPGTLLGVGGATALWYYLKFVRGGAGQSTYEAYLKIMIACICSSFVILQWRQPAEESKAPWRPGSLAGWPIGVIIGITTTFAHAAGVILNMFLLPQKLDKRVFVGTCGRFFFTVNMIKVPFMFLIGVMSLTTLKYGVWLMILGPVGVALGSQLNKWLSPKHFVRLIYCSLLLTATKLVYDAIAALSRAA